MKLNLLIEKKDFKLMKCPVCGDKAFHKWSYPIQCNVHNVNMIDTGKRYKEDDVTEIGKDNRKWVKDANDYSEGKQT